MVVAKVALARAHWASAMAVVLAGVLVARHRRHLVGGWAHSAHLSLWEALWGSTPQGLDPLGLGVP